MQGGLLDRIWVRLGLCIAGTLLATMGLLAGSVLVFSELRYQDFFRSLPAPVQEELSALNENDEENSPRAMAIYSQYWRGDLLFSEKLSLLVGLVVCLPFGLAVGFWVSRLVTLPLASMSEAATRVAQGDLTVRAQDVAGKGEMAEMVLHFNQMVDGLEDMARERRATAAAISHELRTPLTAIHGSLQLLQSGMAGDLPDDARELVTLSAQSSERLVRLVNDVLDLERMTSGRMQYKVEPCLLSPLAMQAIRDVQPLAEAKEVKLLLEAAEPLTVLGDHDRLLQVAINLLANAVKFSPRGGTVKVAVRRHGDDARFSVVDHGAGVPESFRSRVFERFAQADSSDRRQRGGTGLGLSICRAIVEAHHGRIDFTSEPGVRTEFFFEIAVQD